jgi:hypothetical protein
VNNVLTDLNYRPYERRLAYAYGRWLARARYHAMPFATNCVYVPDSPATIILSFPIALPLVVNGLRDGICMLGMTSCGKLSIDACCVGASTASSSPLDVIA